MKAICKISGAAKILFGLLLCLLLTKPSANCIADTIRSTSSDTTKLNKLLPLVVRDLQLCDLTKQENTVLKKYNADLQAVASRKEQENAELEKKAEKATKKVKKRNRIILIETGAIAVLIAALRLLK